MPQNPFPPLDERRAAQLQRLDLAEALCTPSVSFAEAWAMSGVARPDLVQRSGGDRFAQAGPPAGRPSSPRAVPTSAHQQLLGLAEQAHAADPSRTAEQCYADQLAEHPELYAEYVRERDDGPPLAQFGEQLGDVVGGINGAAIPRDREYDARPELWAARARQLVEQGAARSVEQGYQLAMSEHRGTGTTTTRSAPAPVADDALGTRHSAWSARASELYRAGRFASWQQAYAAAMQGQ